MNWNKKKKKKRTSDAGRRVINGRVYDSKLGETCHWCRQKTVEDHIYCSRCPIRFCGFCLANRHGEVILDEMQIQWVCPKCRGGCGRGCTNCCNCGPCRKAQELEVTGRMIHKARGAGFDNVHDYLIHEKTGESAQEVARRKEGRKWTKAGGAEPSEMIVPVDKVFAAVKKTSRKLSYALKKRSRCPSESEWSFESGSGEESESESECLYRSKSEDGEEGPAAAAPATPERQSNRTGVSQWLKEVKDDEARLAARLERQKALQHAKLICKDEEKRVAGQSRSKQKPPVKVIQEPEWEPLRKVKQEPDWEPDVHPDEYDEEEDEVDGLAKSPVQAGRELSYKELLQQEIDRPFDSLELDELLEAVNKRKPVKRHRETRRGTRLIETRSQGMSYFDYHPDLSSEFSAAVTSTEKLKVLRGFFFWIEHACMEGAFKPWMSGFVQEEDCQVVDGFDCEITSVVVSLNSKTKHYQQRRQQQLQLDGQQQPFHF